MGFWCKCCGQWHEGMLMDIAYDPPASLVGTRDNPLPDIEIGSDWAYNVQKAMYLIRGVLPITVTDQPEETFNYGVWATVHPKDFWRMMELWNDERCAEEPPYFGFLVNTISGYPETYGLVANVVTFSVTERPHIELEPTDHPLAVEQREGITMTRVQEIVERVLHPDAPIEPKEVANGDTERD